MITILHNELLILKLHTHCNPIRRNYSSKHNCHLRKNLHLNNHSSRKLYCNYLHQLLAIHNICSTRKGNLGYILQQWCSKCSNSYLDMKSYYNQVRNMVHCRHKYHFSKLHFNCNDSITKDQ